jgi:hypothetical protein
MNNGSKNVQKTIIDTTTASSFNYHAQQQPDQQQTTITAFGDEACNKRKAGRSPIRILNVSIKRKIHLQI